MLVPVAQGFCGGTSGQRVRLSRSPRSPSASRLRIRSDRVWVRIDSSMLSFVLQRLVLLVAEAARSEIAYCSALTLPGIFLNVLPTIFVESGEAEAKTLNRPQVVPKGSAPALSFTPSAPLPSR